MDLNFKELYEENILTFDDLESINLNELSCREHIYGLLIIKKRLEAKGDFCGASKVAQRAIELIQFEYRGFIDFKDKENSILYFGFIDLIKRFDIKSNITKVRFLGFALAILSFIFTKDYGVDLKYSLRILAVVLFVIVLPSAFGKLLNFNLKRKYNFTDDYVFDVVPQKWIEFTVDTFKPVDENTNDLLEENTVIEEVEIVNDNSRDN